METTRYTGKDLAQRARDTAKAYKLKLVSWDIVVHNEGASIHVQGIDKDGFTNIIAVAL
jgi:hypothetical protein